MKLLRAANELLAFVIEVLALLALGWWGAHAAGWWLALLLPLAAAVLWGLFAAPKATFRVALPAVLAVKAVVFGGAVAALAGLHQPTLAWVFGVVAAANTAAATSARRP
ncbi:YrdB family protein [Streptacidiphilus monticola]|uniref:YrdB family protein n=1 Tax=Streptacidiphilus monticola TaxID=2161674 RepID=A0ABW1G2Z1_9ACTN